MHLSVGWVSRWVASSICRGVASSEAEMRCAVEGLDGEASSEAEIALRVRGEFRIGRTVEVGCVSGLFESFPFLWIGRRL
jgi:hypothetical protein